MTAAAPPTPASPSLPVMSITLPAAPTAPQSKKRLWNSLEVAKVAISLLLPILTAYIALKVADIKQAADEAEKNSTKVDDIRYQLYSQLGGKLNLIFVYCTYVGEWKEHTPVEILKCKRECDATVYTYQFVFSKDFMVKYRAFINACFKQFRGFPADAGLRTSATDRRVTYQMATGKEWDEKWDGMFTEEDVQPEMETAYSDFMQALATELHINVLTGNEVHGGAPLPTRNQESGTQAKQRDGLSSADATLSEVSVEFRTGNDDKDAHTALDVSLVSGNNLFANKFNVMERFDDQQTNVVALKCYEGILPRDMKGTALIVKIRPDGHDTWKFSGTITTRWSDGTSQKVDFAEHVLDFDHPSTTIPAF